MGVKMRMITYIDDNKLQSTLLLHSTVLSIMNKKNIYKKTNSHPFINKLPQINFYLRPLKKQKNFLKRSNIKKPLRNIWMEHLLACADSVKITGKLLMF